MSVLDKLQERKAKLEEELVNVEAQLFDLETSYLNDSAACGTVLHGFETFLTANKTASSAKKPKAFKPEERLFSLSSVTSPASRDGAH